MVKKGMTSTRKRATSHLAPLRPQRQGLPSQKPQLLPSFKPQREVLPTQKPQRDRVCPLKNLRGQLYRLSNLRVRVYPLKNLRPNLHSLIDQGPYLYSLKPQPVLGRGPPQAEAVNREITRQVCRFLGVFGWFVNNAVTQTRRMILAFEEIEAPPTITEEAPVSVSTKAKMEVKVLVQKLVTRIFKNAKVNNSVGNSVGIVECLLEKVWAKVEGEIFTVTQDTFQTLDKVVYKDLVRIWGCAESVLMMFHMEVSSEENCVASIFKARLMCQPKKRGAVCKFFRSVGKAICKPFRRNSEPVWVL
ncbi:Chaperone protein ClpB2 chloroplastic [Dissostichus eleginoides]|uniref:Chaperone protein ClpB2 chloroplastic n=1 Tax=Dissostichus eleginoides TaxID=100907 RepID=A0AAD9C6L2_DISEL|nr:Chaperone protein ClpB2 chloroplastic [Dissostichus eleginoides]